MDRSWIGMQRNIPKYLLGLNQFLDFAFTNGAIGDKIKYPCPICGFKKWQTKEVVFHHLMNKNFPKHYVTWVVHGEIDVLPNSRDIEVTQYAQPFETSIELLINEAFRGLRHEVVDAGPSQVAGEGETLHDLSGSNNKDYFELLKDGSEDLYEGSKDAFKFAKIPISFYEAKKTIDKLCLDYIKIYAFPNDCMLYWEDDVNAESCKYCHTSRWKPEKDINLDHAPNLLHIEKNVFDNVIYTLLNDKEKSKNHAKDRRDLQDMGIRSDLWVDENDECKFGAFAIPKNKKVAFLKTLKNISVSDGYSNMPRFKRMQKKEKLGPSVSTLQAPIDQDTPHPGPAVFPESQPSPINHLTSYPSLVDRDSSQPYPIGQDSSYPSPVGRDSSQPSSVGRDSSQPLLNSSQPSPVGWDSSQLSPIGRDSSYPYPIGPNSSQPSRSVHSTSHLGLKNQDSSQLSLLVHITSHSTPTNQDSSQPAPTDEAASQKYSRRESNTHWVIDAIDSRNNVKKIKVKAKEILNIVGEEHIVVNFDVYDEPFGEACSLILRFCGILACDCSLFPINFEKWSSLPMTYFNRIFEHIIKPKFFFDTAESIARRHISLSIGKKWAANKINMWNEVDDPLKIKAQIMDKPSDVTSGPISPMDAKRSLDDNDPNDIL
ncbi:hypothetical protein CQW23_26472 [Capsicum baccatum]|uniref:Transposase-associated domain-containing protein n=1 Tax=Capsicum baccatum TaxID=33114 RepID=A0A2G2VNX8_CAPBA|nr:hypothetical protein CQW23_26472 [Capsicum baccatum]